MSKVRTLLSGITLLVVCVVIRIIYEEFDTSQSWFSSFYYGNLAPPHEYHPIRLFIICCCAAAILIYLWTHQELFLASGMHIFTFKNTVVTYELRPGMTILDQLEKKHEHELTRILTAQPNADLSKYENVLGIKIINTQRSGASQKTDSSKDDVPIGKIKERLPSSIVQHYHMNEPSEDDED